MSIEENIWRAYCRLDNAMQEHKPIAVFGLYSGGHDSFSACYIASLHPRFTAMVHINTGIGIEATRDHVRNTCVERRWPLLEYKATENCKADGTPDPMIYEEIVLAEGFPGPYAHRFMYIKLKERALNRLCRHFPGKIILVSGARSEESVRRMGTVNPIQEDGNRIWVAPIHDWTKLDTTRLIEHVGAKRNTIVDLIHKSGECLCGAYAHKGELAELALWEETRPAYERIMALQKRVIAAGFPWGWGDAPPKEYLEEKRGQMMIEPFKQFLCWKCNAQNI